jgi:hypothetical protein
MTASWLKVGERDVGVGDRAGTGKAGECVANTAVEEELGSVLWC